MAVEMTADNGAGYGGANANAPMRDGWLHGSPPVVRPSEPEIPVASGSRKVEDRARRATDLRLTRCGSGVFDGPEAG